jgi:hypothetical protein
MAVSEAKWLRMLGQVASKVDALEPDAREKLDKAMDIEFMEHFCFQEEKSKAVASELLSVEVGHRIYMALGSLHTEGNGGWAKDTNLATKCLVTQLMHELLDVQLAHRSHA